MSAGHLQKSYLWSEEEKFIISPSTLKFRVLLIVGQGFYALLQREHISDHFSNAECVRESEMVSIGDEHVLHEMSQPREDKSRLVHQQIIGGEWVIKETDCRSFTGKLADVNSSHCTSSELRSTMCESGSVASK
jgi:hypothetical protein